MGTERQPPSKHGRLVLIIGANRSGTTWLNQLMQAHREVCGIDRGETELFLALMPLWHDCYIAADPSWNSASAAFIRPVRSFCDELIDGAQERSGRPDAKFFVEKTPRVAVALPMLRYVYPDAWYIHIVRDGRDVARSWRRYGYETGSDLANSYFWGRHEDYAEGLLAGFDRVINIRYEDLYADPVRVILEVYARLGLSRYPGLIREIGNRCAEPVALYAHESSVGSGKWRRDVSRWRLAAIYAGAGDRLLKHGYVDAGELARWRRRPTYWLATARRALMQRGVASRSAVRVFRFATRLGSAACSSRGRNSGYATAFRPRRQRS
jgi:hypothetical protein